MKNKSSMTNLPETARLRFSQKFNCAQSVFATFAPQLGLEEQRALKMASPFGGGVARRGQVCGAVSGALMALGLGLGTDTPAGKEDAYRMGGEFLERFEARHGSILCRDLLNIDISTPEGHQKASENGLFTSLCPLYVGNAVEIVQEMLAEKS
jgi:C_GCAxxG_C_C family probable redox protein